MSEGRSCGSCQACCRLLPVRDLGKGANIRCKHQRFGKGCAIYAQRPVSCAIWTCRWKSEPNCGLPRPDRCHYVVDVCADFLEIETDDTRQPVPVIQIWLDPLYPTAYRCERLLTYLDAQYLAAGHLGLVRRDAYEAFVLLPPRATGQDFWCEMQGTSSVEHTPQQIFETIGSTLDRNSVHSPHSQSAERGKTMPAQNNEQSVEKR